MPEIAETQVSPKKSLTKIFLMVLSVLIILLAYGVGNVVLPTAILRNYQNKDCDSTLSLDNLYTSVYPGFLQRESFSVQVRECEAYVLAASNEEDGIWQDAYDAYQVYLATYPDGLYGKEAHEHSAIVLMNIIKEQDAQKKYDKVITDLNLITSSYSDTSESAEAWKLIPSTYTSWGAGLRESKDFEKSEQVFNDFKAWLETNQKNELAKDATSELAQTYVAWGQDLQSQKQFEDALKKYEMAVTFDPEPGLASGAAGQARSGQRQIYIEWGNDLLKQNQISAAMEKFERAVSLGEGDMDDGARDALANGHIKWASSLRTDDDFRGALEQLEIAKGTALSGETKKSVDIQWGETYEAFSNSTGAQAQRAIKDALNAVCKQHKKPDLPIFGLNKDLIRVGVYGVDPQLPENLAAKTPGELHYIACIDVQNHIVQSRYKRYIIQRTSRGYYYRIVQQFRAEVLWNIKLLSTDTMKNIAEVTLTGGTPPPFPEGDNVGGGFTDGPPPTEAQLSDWLQSFIK